MGESDLILRAESEDALTRLAAAVARAWRSGGHGPLLIGLRGELGSGKTTWVRSMLRGLGYGGRVPSPTYTLLEQYPVNGLRIVHLDLYRLADAGELEFLGIRDYLADDDVWVLAEWPERAQSLLDLCDLLLDLTIEDGTRRLIRLSAATEAGQAALEAIPESDSRSMT